jgi:glycosyltransferase involved in cell wall biosynthesis
MATRIRKVQARVCTRRVRTGLDQGAKELMKIAYLSTFDPHNLRAWSGAGYYLARALELQGANLHPVGRLAERRRQLLRLKQLAYRRLGVPCLYDRVPSLISAYAREAKRRLPPDCDVILSAGTTAIAGLKPDRPIVLWTDATFASMVDYYPEFSNLPACVLEQGHAVEREALARCTLALYTSEWAAASAIRDYGADPDKVKVVPFGANTSLEHTLDEIDAFITARQHNPCTLLFLGTDWNRKGGDMAVSISEELVRRGISLTLHVVGCKAPWPLPRFVKVHDFISKQDPAGMTLFNDILRSAHFLVLPVKAECNANVFAEACSFGVPVTCTRTGGVTTSVRDGTNGMTFPPDSGASAYADYIQSALADGDRYRQIALGAHREYLTRLNWNVAAASALRLMESSVWRGSMNRINRRRPCTGGMRRCEA